MADRDTPETFQARLRAALDAANLSNRKLGAKIAKRTGTKPETGQRNVQRWLAGGEPERRHRIAAAEILKLPPDYFLNDVAHSGDGDTWSEIVDLQDRLARAEDRLRSLDRRHAALRREVRALRQQAAGEDRKAADA